MMMMMERQKNMWQEKIPYKLHIPQGLAFFLVSQVPSFSFLFVADRCLIDPKKTFHAIAYIYKPTKSYNSKRFTSEEMDSKVPINFLLSTWCWWFQCEFLLTTLLTLVISSVCRSMGSIEQIGKNDNNDGDQQNFMSLYVQSYLSDMTCS